MYHTGATMGEKASKEQKVTASKQTQALTMSRRNRLTNRGATATPLQSYCRHPHQIPERLMYNTDAAMGEKTSKEQRVTATEQQKSLISVQKITLRIDPPHLRRSRAIVLIRIKFLID
jgi:hypothetical protein